VDIRVTRKYPIPVRNDEDDEEPPELIVGNTERNPTLIKMSQSLTPILIFISRMWLPFFSPAFMQWVDKSVNHPSIPAVNVSDEVGCECKNGVCGANCSCLMESSLDGRERAAGVLLSHLRPQIFYLFFLPTFLLSSTPFSIEQA
jgi:hypothetical protein